MLTIPTAGGSSVSVADCNSVATATGADALVIGGTGVHDGTVRMRGDYNVTTYDDGNATVGGSGDVNSQIGDSAHSGAVVMAVRDSHIASGGSISPAPNAPTPCGGAPPAHPSSTAAP